MNYYFAYPKLADIKRTWEFLVKAYNGDDAWQKMAPYVFGHLDGHSIEDFTMLKVKISRLGQEAMLDRENPIVVDSRDVGF